MAVFKGAGVAIVTPFKENFEVDYERFAALIEYQITNKTDAIIVCGTTGEASTLSDEEHIEVIRFCVEKVNGRIPVVAGTGSNSTQTAIFLSKEAQAAGADAILLVTPYYNKCTQKGLRAHFKMVADSINIPVILYNIPGRTGGVNILPETIVSLCTEVDNIAGVKDASGNFSQLAELASLAKGKVDIYSGNDDQVVPLLSLGGVGVISVASNIVPEQIHQICARFFAGDVEGSRNLQLDLLETINALFIEVNPIPVKTAMNLMGMKVGSLRMPLTEMEEQNVEILRKAMQRAGLI